jgi:hypothetical protein
MCWAFLVLGVGQISGATDIMRNGYYPRSCLLATMICHLATGVEEADPWRRWAETRDLSRSAGSRYAGSKPDDENGVGAHIWLIGVSGG